MPPCNCHHPFPRPEPFSPLPRPGKVPDWGKWIRDRLAEKGALLVFPGTSAFPDPGAGPNLYLAEDTDIVYRWDGAHYQVVFDPDLANDVLEYENRGHFPETGHHGKLYIAADTGSLYRWDDTNYAELLPGKADKAVPQAEGNLAALAQDGNLMDSGKKPSDFQPTLTFDSTPTAGSQNPVTSEGIKRAIDAATPEDYAQVKSQVQANTGDIAGIKAVIPRVATARNQLVDTATMNSSIATNTAHFLGTKSYVTDLGFPQPSSAADVDNAAIATALGGSTFEQTPTNNDYVFVSINYTPTTDVDEFRRFKFNDTTGTWAYEYTLNNSSFTAAQWAAINSGITSGAVEKLGALPTAAELTQALAGKMAATATGANIAVSGGDPTKIDAALAGKANKSEVDPLLCAQYYPDGSVKSAAEFTPGIKYNDPDTTNRTIAVKPFCNTGVGEADNSGLVGRVVIPPFVDAQGNGYISDDGTRFKVVGVSDGIPDDFSRNLTAIVAPTTVTSIEDYAFENCGSLTAVSFPAVTSIEYHAFAYCYSLASVDFGDTPRSPVPSLGEYAFDGVPTSCKIIVPYTQYDAWKAANGWKDLSQEFVRHTEKADKPATFTAENLAKFDANGNPVDSEKKPSDFQNALSDAQLANIAAVSDALAFDATHSYAAGDPVVYNGTLYTFTAAHTGAWTGSDVSAVDIIARLAGKLDKGGGTVGPIRVYEAGDEGGNVTIASDYGFAQITPDGIIFSGRTLLFPQMRGIRTFAVVDNIPYDLAAKTITNGAVTLDDHAMNAVSVSSALASLTINFPTATSGKVRDFGLRLSVASGITTAPELVLPQGVTCENADGEVPEIGADGAATILYFTETTAGVFLVKGEVVTAIS